MAKFNAPSKTKLVTNLAGGEAYDADAKFKFVSILLTSFVNDQHYRSANQTLDELRKLMPTLKDWRFVAKAAIYARTQFGMRSITHVTAAEVARNVKAETWPKHFFNSIVYRPDDMTEIVSYYLNRYKKPLPNAMKKGLAAAFGRFDAYALAKYRGEGKAVKLIDIVNLCHPKPSEKAATGLKRLVDGTLRSQDTWESKLTQAGKSAESEAEKADLKKAAWKDLIRERKLGYFALLRNLRNISEQAPEALKEALKMLVDEKLIRKSLVLPFRFSTAIDQISDPEIIRALNKALDISCQNVPKFPGLTLVACDQSGSMAGRPIQIAALFSAIMAKANQADVMNFADDAGYVRGLNPDDSTLTIAKLIESKNGERGYGTNFQDIFDKAQGVYDHIFIFSDMQAWIGGRTPLANLQAYMTRTGANPKIYSFDLAGYGSIQFPKNRIYQIAGFSEKTFDVIKFLETDRDELYKRIEEIPLEPTPEIVTKKSVYVKGKVKKVKRGKKMR